MEREAWSVSPVRAPERARYGKPTPNAENLRISVRVDQVHVSGALSGACTGKGPQMANPRPTPKPRQIWTGRPFSSGEKTDSLPSHGTRGESPGATEPSGAGEASRIQARIAL